jgi:hypothetical protein
MTTTAEKHIFISFSSKDAKRAFSVCEDLENRDLKCWISSRDVRPGHNYQQEIIDALKSATHLLLIFSANANSSGEIARELSLASKEGIPIVPLRVEEILPSNAMEYTLATSQWVDAFEDWNRAMELVAAELRRAGANSLRSVKSTAPRQSPVPDVAEGAAPTPSAAVSPRAAAPERSGGGSALLLFAGCALLLAVAAGGGVYWYLHRDGADETATAPTFQNAAIPAPAKTDVPSGPPAPKPLDEADRAYNRGDYGAALRLYTTAANAGDPQAEYQVGYMYQFGQGISQDYQAAVHWYALAAAQGSKMAQVNLGYLSAHGFGTARDYAAALRWYQLAAEQGSAPAQYQLGDLYEKGYGVPVNYAQAFRWYKAAADQGLAIAQYCVGRLYAAGFGVQRDLGAARDWMKRAADGGNADARKWLASQ